MKELLVQRIMQDIRKRYSEEAVRMYLVKVRSNMSTQSHKKVTNTKKTTKEKEIKEVNVWGDDVSKGGVSSSQKVRNNMLTQNLGGEEKWIII